MLAAIALGSNLPSHLGAPLANLREALQRLRDLGDVAAISSFHTTEPVGYRDQPQFTNAAALLRTDFAPLELMRALLEIETSMGRIRAEDAPPKGPRIIDLDLLLYEDDALHSLVLNDPDLILPHPAMHERRFVLEPLAEVAPGMLHPVLQRSIAELAAAVR